MKIEFITDTFEQSHGKMPRGRGSWAFCPYEQRNANDYLDHTKFSPSMTYVDAKRWARAQRWPQGTDALAVLP